MRFFSRPLIFFVTAMLGCVVFSESVSAQSVGISNVSITPDPQSILELRTTTKGVLLPRLTSAERATLTSSPLAITDEGLTIYNTTTNRYNYWDGTQWVEMASSGSVTGLTLDDAYDAGGSGTGRTITADAGSVDIVGAGGLLVSGGKVGIGTTSPNSLLELNTTSGGSTGNFLLKTIRNSGVVGDLIGIGFGVQGGAHIVKSGIVHERETTNGVGKIHFLVDNSTDGNDASLSEARMTIDRNGNVGVGTRSPVEDLHVYRADSDVARVYATGNSQGSGMIFAGQSSSYGGGFVYDGDGTPALVGGTDRITFFRRNANTDYDVMSYGYSNSQLRVSDLAGSGNAVVMTDNDGDLYESTSLVGSGLGDNLGNHIATTTLNLQGNAVTGSAGTVLDGGGGWHRSYGSTGWYNGTYGGGIYMSDGTWIRTYGSKSFYHNTGNFRTDGTLQVGSSGGTLNVPNGGNFAYRTNVLFANTANNVGVGTISPTSKLHVYQSGTCEFQVHGSTTAQIRMRDDDDQDTYWLHNNGGRLYFLWNGGTGNGGWNGSRPITLYNGNVGINNTTPTYQLHVNGRLKTTGINETSDKRLKENIKDLENPLEKILQMRGVTYEWKKDAPAEMIFEEGTQYGLIAQELELVIPELVDTEDNENAWKSIEYSHIVPILIEAIKEQNRTITSQAGDISDLKAQATITQQQLQQLMEQVNGVSSNHH